MLHEGGILDPIPHFENKNPTESQKTKVFCHQDSFTLSSSLQLLKMLRAENMFCFPIYVKYTAARNPGNSILFEQTGPKVHFGDMC